MRTERISYHGYGIECPGPEYGIMPESCTDQNTGGVHLIYVAGRAVAHASSCPDAREQIDRDRCRRRPRRRETGGRMTSFQIDIKEIERRIREAGPLAVPPGARFTAEIYLPDVWEALGGAPKRVRLSRASLKYLAGRPRPTIHLPPAPALKFCGVEAHLDERAPSMVAIFE